jgi:hypothetical protein
MQASAIRYTLIYLTPPKQQLLIWTVAGPATAKLKSESESDLLYNWRFSADQFVLATSPLRLTTSNFIFLTEHLRL